MPSRSARRDHRGVMVTVIADNYYGYCKKEVKTQISYAANLYGLCEEEHAGGAMAFATYVLGQDFDAGRTVSLKKATFEQGMDLLGDMAERKPEGYAIDRRYPEIYYVPEDAVFSVRDGQRDLGTRRRIPPVDAAPHRHLCFTVRLPRAAGEATFRIQLEADWIAPARDAVPQTVHGFGRRQVGNLEVDRQRAAERSGLRARLPSRYGRSGGDPEEGFLRRSIKAGLRTRACSGPS